jgi:hypothetical protein
MALVPMGGVVTSAGRTDLRAVPALDPLLASRKEAIRAARRIIRNPAATDEQVDDALEALVELAKET